MIIDQEHWDKCFKGYLIYDAVISKDGRYWLVLMEIREEDDDEDGWTPDQDEPLKTRFLSINVNKEMGKRFSAKEYNYFSRSRIAFVRGDNPEIVAVDIDGHVYSYNTKSRGTEHKHPRKMEGSEMGMLINQVVRIGDAIYTACDFRRCYKRLGMEQWQDMTANLALPPAAFDIKLNADHVCWEDIDGFSENDIYAVGGYGDVWHFDGKEWLQCDFPSNELLNTVACAGDGNVYIGGNLGSLWVGRKDTWKLITKGNFSIDWKDIAWFADQLWLSSDYGLWVLNKDKIEQPKLPDGVQACTGVIDITPDGSLMLTAGHNGAALFDGKEWEVLFNRVDFEGTFYS